MKFLVLGAGLQGSACAYDLLQNPAVTRVVVADLNVDQLPSFLETLRSDSRLELKQVDARDPESLRSVMAGVDVCLNALPYYFNLEVTRLALEAGLHYADLGGNTAIVFDQLKLDDTAKANNVTAIPDCGLAPGMVNILAETGIKKLDEAERVRIYVGGLPQDPQPPLNYQIVYSLHGVLDYYTTPSWVLRDGEPHQVEALSEVERVDFPAPVGELEAFHTAGGLSTMAWTYQGKLRNMEYKTLRYPGHADTMRAIRGLGLLELTPVNVRGQDVVPREAFIASAEPRLKRPEGRDLVALRVVVEGKKNGQPATVGWELIDYYDEAHHISAMERTTGYSLSITGQMMATGRTNGPGVLTSDLAMPGEEYIEELAKRGINLREI